MKMYILVKNSIPLGLAMAAVAHASIAATLKWQGSKDFETWQKTSFKKVICRVNEKELNQVILTDDKIVITESALDDEITAIIFKPRKEWPKKFKYYGLYK